MIIWSLWMLICTVCTMITSALLLSLQMRPSHANRMQELIVCNTFDLTENIIKSCCSYCMLSTANWIIFLDNLQMLVKLQYFAFSREIQVETTLQILGHIKSMILSLLICIASKDRTTYTRQFATLPFHEKSNLSAQWSVLLTISYSGMKYWPAIISG